jgi:hypothetical protein
MTNSCRESLAGVFPPTMTCFVDEKVACSLTDEESLKIVDVYRRHRGKGNILMVGAARESLKATGLK